MTIHARIATLFMFLIAVTTSAWADDTPFQLVRAGRSYCTIVLPDKPVEPAGVDALSEEMIDYRCRLNLHQRLVHAAKMLSEDIAAFTGAQLPIVTESEKPAGNVILIGDTVQTQALGLNDADLLAKHYVIIRVTENKLILNGRANAYLDNGAIRRVRGYSGAAAAVYHFMDRHLGISHFAPGTVGREYPAPTDNLSVPGNLDVKFNPSVLFGGELGEIPDYHDYNRGGKFGSFLMYGGHSWIYQVPPEVYFDRKNRPETYHPEYYALVNGRRITDAEHGGSLCTEHPDVLRISVENIGKLFDSGIDVVEMGQPDSYDAKTACQCELCMKVGDTSAQGLGARITKFHVSIAQELLKTHPDKHVLHLMYGASYFIPESYKGPLPENMMLQYADWGSDDFAKIEEFAHLQPAGITAYLYSFVGFSPFGYGGPKVSVTEIKQLFEVIKKHRVQFIYWCGRADSNLGMEGPQYWLAQQLQWDYNQDPDRLMEEYWTRYFKQAAGPMKTLYGAIEERKAEALQQLKREYGSSLKAYARHIYPTIFNSELNTTVDACLQEAFRLAGDNGKLHRRIRMVEEAYAFNRLTTDCFLARTSFEKDRTVANLAAWRETLTARSNFVTDLERRLKSGELEDFYLPVIPMMAFYDAGVAKQVKEFGSFNVGDTMLVNREVRHMKGFGIKSAVAQRFDSPPNEETWANMEPVNRSIMHNNENGEVASVNAAIKLGWDMQNMYVQFSCEEPTGTLRTSGPSKHDDDLEATDAVEVVAVPVNERGYLLWAQCKRLAVNAAGVTRDVRVDHMRHAPDDLDSSWDGKWTANVDEGALPGKWTATLVIPWDTIDGMPAPGQDGQRMILMNFIRYRPARDEDGANAIQAWMPTFGDVTNAFRCGEITLREHN